MQLFGHLEVLLLLSVSAVTHAAIYWDWGRCPDVTVKNDFVIDNYLGTWYEIARYPAPFQSDEAKCTQAVYSPSDVGPNYVDVTNSGILPDGTVTSIQGEAWIPDPSEPGKLLVRFSPYAPAGDYWVLDTDYDLYSLVHTCESYFFGIVHTQVDWILSRNRALDDTTINQLYDKLTGQGISTEPFMYTDQSGCDILNAPNSQKSVDCEPNGLVLC